MRKYILFALVLALLLVGVAGAATTFTYDPPPENGTVTYDAAAVQVPFTVDPPEQCVDPPAATGALGGADVTVNVLPVCIDPVPVSGQTTYDAGPVQVPYTHDPPPREVTVPESPPPPPPPPPPAPTLGASLFPLLGPSTGASRYISPVGSDAGDCAAITAPCATFARAETVAQPGDTVYFRAGTYTQNVSIDKVATAANPVTFRNYPGETAVLHAASTANEMVRVECTARNVRLQGFVIEATPLLWTGTTHQALSIYGATCGAQNIEVLGNLFEGFQAGTTTRHDLTPTLTGPLTQRVDYISNTVRHWGPGTSQRQGIYHQGQNGQILNNLIYSGLHGFGIQVRGESSSVFANGTIVAGNTVVDWPQQSTAGGRGIAVEDTARGVRVRNNVSAFSVSSQAELYGIDGPASDPPASSNRAFGNLVWDGLSTANCGNTAGHSILDFSDGQGVYTSCGQNLRGDPLFVNRSAGDFQLGAGSAAIGYADPDWILPFDITGKARDADPDAGAYER